MSELNIQHGKLIAITTIVSVLVAIVTLICNIIAQNDLLREQISAVHIQNSAFSVQVMQAQDQPITEINKLLFDHTELYPYFYSGRPLSEAKDAKEQTQVLLLSEMFLDFIESFSSPHIQAVEGMKPGEVYMNAWEDYFMHLFQKSPTMCSRILEKRCWYSNDRFVIYYNESCIPKEKMTKLRVGCKSEAITSNSWAKKY